MNKLTAEVARMDIGHLREIQSMPHVGLSMKEEKYLQALEIALPVLEHPEPAEYQYYYHNHGTGTGEWLPVKSKQKFEEMKEKYAGDNDFSFRELFTHPSTTPQIDNDGWIENPGFIPVPPKTRVEVKFNDGGTDNRREAWVWSWELGDTDSRISAYRVIENDGREG